MKTTPKKPSAAPLIDDVSAVLASGDGPWTSAQIRDELAWAAAARVSSALWRLRRCGAAREVLRGGWVGPTSRWWDAQESPLSPVAYTALRVLVDQGPATTAGLAEATGATYWSAWSWLRPLKRHEFVCKGRGGWVATQRGRQHVATAGARVSTDVAPPDARLAVHARRAAGVIIERGELMGALIGHIAPAHRDGERGWVVVRLQGRALSPSAQLETFTTSRAEVEQVAERLWLAAHSEEDEP